MVEIILGTCAMLIAIAVTLCGIVALFGFILHMLKVIKDEWRNF